MAKNTSKMDSMETQLVEIVQNQSTFQASVQQQFEEMSLRMEGFTQTVEEVIAKKMTEAIKEITSVAGKENINPNINFVNTSNANANVRVRNDTGLLATPPTRANEHVNAGTTRIPKFEFTKFNGDNPRLWLRRCNKYFFYNALSDFEKIVVAGMNMEATADHWYLEYVEGRENMPWERFSTMVLDRFLNVDGNHLVGQFNKLKQEGTLLDYINEFEELRAFMLEKVNRNHSEEYFVESFISGLKKEIKNMLELLQPKTLLEAMQLARR
ncbi:hypothetical protein DH2020_029316 [Rehmannia glutinosa]|uniref:Ty3 transposon capsid-like protein domain-containing protein n=1 Tax=Rehmannia glutinosa TaxID=99300 RepID=A0ABR0VQN8_REHGL